MACVTGQFRTSGKMSRIVRGTLTGQFRTHSFRSVQKCPVPVMSHGNTTFAAKRPPDFRNRRRFKPAHTVHRKEA